MTNRKIKLACRYPRQALRSLRPGNGTIRYAQMFVTTACNSRCPFCCFADMLAEPQNMTQGMAESALDQLRRFTPIVKLIGGEPLLWPRLWDTTALAARLGMMPNISTNGFLLGRYAHAAVKAGAAVMNVSIDGCDEAQFAARNGMPGTFARVTNGVAALNDARGKGLPYTIAHTAVTKDNWHSLRAINELVNQLGFDEHHIFPFGFYTPDCEVGNGDAAFVTGMRVDGNDRLLTKNEWLESIRQLDIIRCRSSLFVVDEMQRRGKAAVHINAKCRQWEHCTLARPRRVTCGRYMDEVNIAPGGDVGICNGAVRLGNLHSEPIERLWRNDRHMEFIESFGAWLPMCFRCCGAQMEW